MMKKIILSILLAMLLLPAGLVMASDITDAEYITGITVTNNSTSDASVVSGTLTLSTADMITAGMINATATDATVHRPGAVDTPFMPGYSTNPWVIYVPTADKQTVQNYYLYSGGVTGGLIRYFPADAGMTTSDDATIELGDNFTINISGYFDTDNNTDKNILFKDDAFAIYTSDTVSGNITATIIEASVATDITLYPSAAGDDTNIPSVTGAVTHWEAVSTMNDATYVHHNTTTHYQDLYQVGNPDVTELSRGTINSVTVYFRMSGGAIGNNGHCVPVFKIDGTSFNGTEVVQAVGFADKSEVFANNPITAVAWTWDDIENMQLGEIIWHDFAAQIVSVSEMYITVNYEHMPLLSTSVLSITSGEYDMTVSANTTHLILTVGVTSNSTLLSGASVPDNANDIVSCQNGSVIYLESQEIEIDGVQRQLIEWEYEATFSDLSGNGNDATPSFRTTSSDADVVLTIVNQESTAGQGQPIDTGTGGWNLLGSVPTTPGSLFTEGGDSFPGAAEIRTFSEDTRAVTYEGMMYIIAFICAGIAGIAVYAATHSARMGIKGSLLITDISIIGVLSIFVFGGDGVIAGFVLIPFLVIAIFLLLLRNPYSPING